MQKVRVRIAPSPTGFAHVGTAYTALLNYAFARHNNGKFIIRIEDSDLKRNIAGADKKIYQALNWLAINWDEGASVGGEFGPYKLSERLDLYKKKADELLEKGLAYEDDGAIRFKNPKNDISFNDLVRGEISFPGDQITDFVLMKSDGYPTYNFNVVVDDIAMGISHVIRGEDHISNTPRQIALYRAFGQTPPHFAHHPMLLNAKKQKLSKRDAAVDIEEYKRQGILPEAFVNFLCLMGWSHPTEREVFSLDEFVEKFTLERVRKSGAIFDTNKLLWLNQQYIQNMDNNEMKNKLIKFFDNVHESTVVEKLVPLVKTRMKTLMDFESLAGFIFNKPQVDKDLLGENYKAHLQAAKDALNSLANWNKESIDTTLMEKVKDNAFHTGKFFMDLRVALTGKKVTPPMSESMEILGKNETLSRLDMLIN